MAEKRWKEAYIQGVDPLGRRPGAGHGHVGRLQEPGPRLCGEIDASSIDRWRATGPGLDATYVKVREAGRIPVAVTVAVAVNDQGRREVLGMAIGASERPSGPSSCARWPGAGCVA